MTYEFLEHTADVMFEARADNLEELFLECAKALNETIHGNLDIIQQTRKKIEIRAENLEQLLYKFLEEFLFLLDSEDLIFNKIEAMGIDHENFTLEATLIGNNAEKYHFTNDVKAITFNNLKIEKENETYKATVVLDV